MYNEWQYLMCTILFVLMHVYSTITIIKVMDISITSKSFLLSFFGPLFGPSFLQENTNLLSVTIH